MTESAPNAGPTPEDVRHEMQGTKAHLMEGVHALGDRAAACATDAAAAVGDAYRGTRDALHAARHAVEHGVADGAAFVGRALDVRRHVRRHPWVGVGTAVALGFACGRLICRRR